MPTYILLATFTDQGIRNVNDTVKRANAFKELAKSKGAVLKDVYWVMGQYDVIHIIDAPDDTVATAVAMSLAKLGNVRTQTLRAFSQAEVENILTKTT